MDIFGTVITSAGLILKFVGACAAYSNDAEALHHKLDWDLRVLQRVNAYLNRVQSTGNNQHLSADDASLIRRTADYLDKLVSRVQKSFGKIERRGFLHNTINHTLWVARQNELKQIQQELHEWTTRFDVRLLGLPVEVRAVIPMDSETGQPPIWKSNNELRGFIELTPEDKALHAREMKAQNATGLMSEIISWGGTSNVPLRDGDRQIIFASRQVSTNVVDRPDLLEKLEAEMGILAAALNCLDQASGIRLLKVDSYFYHADIQQFIFTHTVPYPTGSIMTLEGAITQDRYPHVGATLSQRFKLSLELAQAVLFLHAAGFVHKNITSSSVVILCRLYPSSRSQTTFQSPVDSAYLMGFDLIRDTDARTTKDGRVQNLEQPESIWDFDIFQHPDRLKTEFKTRYTKTHDVYSLGVLLLEIGLWEPLSEADFAVDVKNSATWQAALLGLAKELPPRIGERFQSMVEWCLYLDGDAVVKEIDFVEHVIDPLEDIVSAIS